MAENERNDAPSEAVAGGEDMEGNGNEMNDNERTLDSIPDARWQAIRAVILDVDGVLTDGRFGYGEMPGEIKFFHTRDGHGIRMALRAGVKVGLLSGRASEANRRRAEELELSFVYERQHDKKAAFTAAGGEHLRAEDVCISHDWWIMRSQARNRCVVANAPAYWTARRMGGDGAGGIRAVARGDRSAAARKSMCMRPSHVTNG